MDEQFLRSAMLFGEEGIARLQAAHVALFGIGGVGGACAEALVRAAALTDEGGLLFIGGSLYMAAELRALLVGRRL